MKKLIYLVIALNLALALTQVLLSASRATDDGQLGKLNTELAEVQLQNERLKTDIYQLSSLQVIQKKAADLALSLVATKYLDLELPVAKAQE